MCVCVCVYYSTKICSAVCGSDIINQKSRERGITGQYWPVFHVMHMESDEGTDVNYLSMGVCGLGTTYIENLLISGR